MQNLLVRAALVGVLCHAVLAGPAAAQAPVQTTAEVAAFVGNAHFCDMFMASTGREDGVSQDYTQGSEAALKSLLRSNPALSIPQAFAFIQTQCGARAATSAAALPKPRTLSQ